MKSKNRGGVDYKSGRFDYRLSIQSHSRSSSITQCLPTKSTNSHPANVTPSISRQGCPPLMPALGQATLRPSLVHKASRLFRASLTSTRTLPEIVPFACPSPKQIPRTRSTASGWELAPNARMMPDLPSSSSGSQKRCHRSRESSKVEVPGFIFVHLPFLGKWRVKMTMIEKGEGGSRRSTCPLKHV
jgi:hypothetical protein